MVIGLMVTQQGLQGFGKKTLFGVRSQSFNGVRQLAGWQRFTYLPNKDTNYVVLAVEPSYERSFRYDKISEFLFGSRELVFSGSLVPGRESTDILADYFGLPSDFKSTVHFNPTITNFVLDFDCYLGLDGICPGLFARIHMPIVYSKWDLKMHECIADPGTTFTSYPAGYLAATSIELSQLTVSANDTAPKDVTTSLEGKAVFGDMRQPLAYGKVFGREYEVRVSDLTASLGYTFLLGNWYHMGLAIRGAAPTGTLRTSEFLFEPIIGNDHHWELGGDFTSHIDFWCDREQDRRIGWYLDAHATHLFGSKQKRSFDMKNNGSGSRYILLEKMAAPTVGLDLGVTPDNVPATIQYQGRLINAINITTLEATINVAVQADIVTKFAYQHKNFEWDLGYSFWVRSKETLGCRAAVASGYAVKGDAQIYGFVRPSINASEPAVALCATQSKATITAGQNISDDPAYIGKGNFVPGMQYTNANCDNPVYASDNLGFALDNVTTADATTFSVTQQFVKTSDPAIMLINTDIDEESALLPRAISNKVFTYFGWSRNSELDVVPALGVGGFCEIANPSVCDNSALPQWGVWFRGGVSF